MVENDKQNSNISVEDHSKVPDKIVNTFRAMISSYGGGVSIEDILPEYEIRTCGKLNLGQFGVSTVLELVALMKDDFDICRSGNSQYYLCDKLNKPEALDLNANDHITEDYPDSTHACSRKLPVEVTKKLTRLLCDEYPSGLNINEITGAYKGFFGATLDDLDPEKYGYASLDRLLSHESGTVAFIREHGNLIVIAAGISISQCEDYMPDKISSAPTRIVGPKENYKLLDIPSLFPMNTPIEVVVGEVCSPSKFWVIHRSLNHSHSLDDMMDRMLEFYESKLGDRYKLPAEEVNIGVPVVAFEPEDNNYYRAIITVREDLSTVKLFYVDYGTVSRSPLSALRYIHKIFFDLPAQAVKASLKDIEPLNGKIEWPKSTSRALLEQVQNALCELSVYGYKNDQLIVELWQSEHNISDIASFLVSSGKAVFKSASEGEDNNLPRDHDSPASFKTQEYIKISEELKDDATERSDSPVFNPIENNLPLAAIKIEKGLDFENLDTDFSTKRGLEEDSFDSEYSQADKIQYAIDTARCLNERLGLTYKNESSKLHKSNISRKPYSSVHENYCNENSNRSNGKEVMPKSPMMPTRSKKSINKIRKPHASSSLNAVGVYEKSSKLKEISLKDIDSEMVTCVKRRNNRVTRASNVANLSYENGHIFRTSSPNHTPLNASLHSQDSNDEKEVRHMPFNFSLDKADLSISQLEQKLELEQNVAMQASSQTLSDMKDNLPTCKSVDDIQSHGCINDASQSLLELNQFNQNTEEHLDSFSKEKNLQPNQSSVNLTQNCDRHSNSYQDVFYSDEEGCEEDLPLSVMRSDNYIVPVPLSPSNTIHIVNLDSHYYLPFLELSQLSEVPISYADFIKLLKNSDCNANFMEIFSGEHFDLFLSLARTGAEYLFPGPKCVATKLLLVPLDLVIKTIPILSSHYGVNTNRIHMHLNLISLYVQKDFTQVDGRYPYVNYANLAISAKTLHPVSTGVTSVMLMNNLEVDSEITQISNCSLHGEHESFCAPNKVTEVAEPLSKIDQKKLPGFDRLISNCSLHGEHESFCAPNKVTEVAEPLSKIDQKKLPGFDRLNKSLPEIKIDKTTEIDFNNHSFDRVVKKDFENINLNNKDSLVENKQHVLEISSSSIDCVQSTVVSVIPDAKNMNNDISHKVVDNNKRNSSSTESYSSPNENLFPLTENFIILDENHKPVVNNIKSLIKKFSSLIKFEDNNFPMIGEPLNAKQFPVIDEPILELLPKGNLAEKSNIIEELESQSLDLVDKGSYAPLPSTTIPTDFSSNVADSLLETNKADNASKVLINSADKLKGIEEVKLTPDKSKHEILKSIQTSIAKLKKQTLFGKETVSNSQSYRTSFNVSGKSNCVVETEHHPSASVIMQSAKNTNTKKPSGRPINIENQSVEISENVAVPTPKTNGSFVSGGSSCSGTIDVRRSSTPMMMEPLYNSMPPNHNFSLNGNDLINNVYRFPNIQDNLFTPNLNPSFYSGNHMFNGMYPPSHGMPMPFPPRFHHERPFASSVYVNYAPTFQNERFHEMYVRNQMSYPHFHPNNRPFNSVSMYQNSFYSNAGSRPMQEHINQNGKK